MEALFVTKLTHLLIITLISINVLNQEAVATVAIPAANCLQLECPSYKPIHLARDYQIRLYKSSVWMSTWPIEDVSMANATDGIGFTVLFHYINGDNDSKSKINMTAPLLTQVTPSTGPFCKSTFVVSFYVPKANQANVPSAKGLRVQKWKNQYVAVRTFGGFATDRNIGVEAAALRSSLRFSAWNKLFVKKTTGYIVAQYNAPDDYYKRVNEIWFLLKNGKEQV